MLNEGVAEQAGTTRRPYSPKEIMGIMDWDRKTAYAAIGRGDIPSIKIGNRIFIPRAAFDRLVNEGYANDRAVAADKKPGAVPAKAILKTLKTSPTQKARAPRKRKGLVQEGGAAGNRAA